MTEEKIKIMNRVQEHYDEVKKLGHEILGVFLQGSQNYSLQYENSDIDTKAIVLPSFDDFVLNRKPVSTTHVFANNEHCDLKDIRLMFECFKKQNINFVEILFTKYYICCKNYTEFVARLQNNNEDIARYNIFAALNCIAGASLEKLKALEHPYPSIIEKIEKYKFDPKQEHTIVRLNEFIKRYINGEKYSDCLISKQKEYLINLKKGIHTLEEARKTSNDFCKETVELKNIYIANNVLEINKNAEQILNEVLLDIMRTKFKEDLKG